MSKYGNESTLMAHVQFDSRAEGEYYLYMLSQVDEGAIKDLHIQPRYELQPAFVYQGKTVQPIVYVGDFDFLDVATGKRVVVDVKGFATKEFKLKAKLFRFKYPDIELRIVEVG